MNIVTNAQSKLLKEKGFNEPCKMVWDNWNNLEEWYGSLLHRNSDKNASVYYSAPEQWQVVEWLRIKHGIWIEVIMTYPNKWEYNCLEIESNKQLAEIHSQLSSPQEAYSAAFDYILTNLI